MLVKNMRWWVSLLAVIAVLALAGCTAAAPAAPAAPAAEGDAAAAPAEGERFPHLALRNCGQRHGDCLG
ncbi:MAG: hypothetical protein IPK16_10750 [Anaerolineales bacterium]|nr:hypothetical protein [Anaerolineales bacterium]